MSEISLLEQEPLFRKRKERPSIFPLDPEFSVQWDLYKEAESSFWTLEGDIDLDDDRKHWAKLTNNEGVMLKKIIKHVFGFFSGADGIVNDNLAANFLDRFDIPEIKCFYGFQIAIENIHNETYGQLINVLVEDEKERESLLNAIHTMPNISMLYDWAQKWIHKTPDDELESNTLLDPENVRDRERSIIWHTAKQIIAFACVEGIMFSGPFCIIFWIKEKGILPGLTMSNEKISTDEGLHCRFACSLFKLIKNKPPKSQILEIVLEAVDFEKKFIESCLDRMIGLNREDMCSYIEFVGDKLLTMLGYQKHWNTKLPAALKFMEKISFNGMTNFFERKVGEYSMGGFEKREEEGAITKTVILDDF